MQKLINIQSELKAPKSNYNKFGDFYYRSCEDILEAAKPLCAKYGCVLLLSDEIEHIGDRYYIKAKAELVDCENNSKICVTALARETESKTKQDAAQLTGSASSYARKYALNGLFCIDDAKDPDTDENTKQRQEADKKGPSNQAKNGQEKISSFQVDEVVEMCDKHHKDAADMCKYFKISAVEEMTVAQYRELKKIFKED